MSGVRCLRRKMMGRGADGGCGTEEKPCPVSRASSSSQPVQAKLDRDDEPAFDLYSQAWKALSERSPFDAEESASRVLTLPVSLAAFLAKNSDARRKHKKPSAEPGSKSPGHGQSPKASTVWDETEEYFRPLVLADLENLVPKLLFSPGDLCLTVPVLRNDGEEVKKDEVAGEVSLESMPMPMPMPIVEENEKAEVVNEEVMEIDTLPEKEGEDGSAMNWLLGNKQRFLLTSERPSKKRKLLGGDAGLEQLLLLPNLQAEPSPLCDYCCLGDSDVKSNQLVGCDSCKVLVHRKCYGVHDFPVGSWMCSWCKQLEVVGKPSKKDAVDPCLRPCSLCPKEGGALKPVGGCSSRGISAGKLKFVHLFCSLWTPEVYVENTETMEPLMNVGGVPDTRTKLVCSLCKVKYGACVRCSHGTCRTSFHPICAREAKHRMEIWGKVGCDNVELRAFCSKHSAFQNIGRLQHSGNHTTGIGDESSVAKPLAAAVHLNKLPKLRLSHKNRNEPVVQDETTSSSSDKLDKNEINLQDASAVRLTPEGGEARLNKNMVTEGVVESANSLPNTRNLVMILKRGKINVGDVASDMGISSDSLEAVLMGETTSFPLELRLKMMKWLQDSVHMGGPMRHLKFRSGCAIPSGSRVARIDGQIAAKVAGPCVSGSVKISEHDVPDAVLIKPLPLRRKSKTRLKILKDNKTICSSGETVIQQNGNGMIDEIGENPVILPGDDKGDVNHEKSPFHDQDCCFKDQEPLETIFGDTSGNLDSTSFPELLPGHKVKTEQSNLSQTLAQPMVERVSSFESGVDQADEFHIIAKNTLPRANLEPLDCDVDVLVSGAPVLKVDEPFSSSYIHPFIKRRLMQVQKHVYFKQKNREADSNGLCANGMFSSEAVTCSSCNYQSSISTFSDMNHTLNAAKVDQFTKAENKEILELSPEDEVEGEIIYLQNRLLDNAVAFKHSSENLISKVVRNIPQELDVLKKQRWDQVLVNQFLYEVREAKKRGRKERKHKEAQAVLAAAAAAAAASSRNSSLRKDANEETIPVHQEDPLKISAASWRAGINSPLIPLAKETFSRSAVAKVSSENHSEIFQMPDFSRENALSCDICNRTETVLNRIFVCSSCKVAVHLDCYCQLKDPIGSWKCELCEEMSSQSRSPRNLTMDNRDIHCFAAQCGLCGGNTGAFRKSTNGQWVHAFCAEWLLELTFRRGQPNPVEGMDAIFKEKDLLTCCICRQNVGVCMKCSYGHCQIAFHPSCARSAGLYLNVKAIGGRLQHKAYCENHSLEQREADSQQHGAEELKSVKQIRVELEKVRLLCERIIRREKLKRELVLCSHDLLASRRDTVAFSLLVRSPFFRPGVSSESANTSINTKSNSGRTQRSNDITVDSTVSGKRTLRLPLRMDIDRRTDNSSTSQLPFKRKLADRTPFSGKQFPHRSTSVAFQNSANDGEKGSKSRKHMETFQKELVMTSDQASMQNQRLPKGFAYVPVGCLSKEKPVTRDSESHEPREPDG